MNIVPTLTGVIERRILANFRIDPNAASRVLPAPFRPQLVDGWAIAGICLIRLAGVRPRGVCEWVGIRSWSETDTPRHYDGLELACTTWRCRPLDVERIHSSFFEDPRRFPAGTVHFDHALLMRDIEHEWIGREPLCCA